MQGSLLCSLLHTVSRWAARQRDSRTAAHLRLVEKDALACGVARQQICQEGSVGACNVHVALILAPLVVLQDAAATCAPKAASNPSRHPEGAGQVCTGRLTNTHHCARRC